MPQSPTADIHIILIDSLFYWVKKTFGYKRIQGQKLIYGQLNYDAYGAVKGKLAYMLLETFEVYLTTKMENVYCKKNNRK